MTATAEQHIETQFLPGLNKVTFQSDGSTIVGNLFLPADYAPGDQLPAVIVAGSWTTVKEQMAGVYARQLASKGFATLAFDFRFYGESEGQPRQWENPAAKISDLSNAATYMLSLPLVDGNALGALGVCASAGYLAHTVARDDRFKAFVAVASWMQTPEVARSFYGGEEGVQKRIELAMAASETVDNPNHDYVPAYDPGNDAAAMFFEVDYYGDPTRGAINSWDNRFAVRGWKDWLTFDALAAAPRVTTPTMLIHSDDAALPDSVRHFHDELQGAKKLYWTTGTQTDFYDQDAKVEEATSEAARWFGDNLYKVDLAADSSDRVEVSSTIVRMLHAIDALDRESVEGAFADSVITDYTSLFGGDVQNQSVDDLLAGWWSLLPGFDATQHLTGPNVVDIAGDRATARCAVTGTHRLDDSFWVVGGHYRFDLVRNATGWSITEMELDAKFVTGDTSLPEQAVARVADEKVESHRWCSREALR